MADRPLKVLYLTNLFSPFQIELAQAVNRQPEIDFHLLFTMRQRAGRQQPHWANFDYADDGRVHVIPEAEVEAGRQADWAAALIADQRPDVLISGQFRGLYHQVIQRTRKACDYLLCYWLEPPNLLRSALRQAAVRQVLRQRLGDADFIFAIGDRAERIYRRAAMGAEVVLLPYAEDLSHCFAAGDGDKAGDRLRFVFSGQLQPRHNIELMLQAARALLDAHGETFELVLSARGPEQQTVDSHLQRQPRLERVIRYDRDFDGWTDRLRPFRQGHVFLYPCEHAGWGLVIPEAMAAGMTVISSRKAEAARYFIRHRVNGIFIENTFEDLLREMRWCLENPRGVRRLGQRARVDARDGDVEVVAPRLARELARLHGRGRRPQPGLSQLVRRVVPW